ncbi:MAG TPA: hypothetical protein VGK49_08810, partial [Ilumatobacteraceae bacterium]
LSIDVTIDAIGFGPTNLSFAINTTAIDVNEQFRVAGQDISLVLPAGPYLRIEANDFDLDIGGVTLRGDFSFEQITLGDGGTAIRVALADVSITLGTDALRLRNGRGSLLILPEGIAGSFAVDVAVAIPNVSLSGELLVEINQIAPATAVDETFVVGGAERALVLEAGLFVRIAGRNLAVSVFGQTLRGNFVFEQAGTVVKVTATDVELSLGDGLVEVSVASALFVVRPDGLAGKLDDATITVNVPNVSVEVTVDVEVKTIAAAVDEDFGADGALELTTLGQYVRVSGDGDIDVFGQTLNGAFSIEQITLPTGTVVKVAISDVDLSFGGNVVSIQDAAGGFIITPAGAAGQLSGDYTLNVAGFVASGTAAIQLNTLTTAVSETFVAGGDTIALDLPAGRFVRVSLSTTIQFSGVGLSGDFVFQQQTVPGGATVTILGVANGNITIGTGEDAVEVDDATGAFVITASNVAGVMSGHVAVEAGGAVSLSGDLLVRYNQTGAGVDTTIEVGGRSINVKFADGELIGFAVSASNLSLNIGDFVSIEGDISFDSAGNFAGQNLEIFLGQGPARLESGEINPLAVGVLLTNARIGLVRIGAGYALHAEGTVMLLGVSGVTISGTAIVDVNTTGQIVEKSLVIPGSTGAPVVVSFPTTALVTKFEALDVDINVLGQTLSGNFSFDRDASTGTISIAASGVGLHLGAPGSGVSITNASGAILVTPQGIAADLSGTVTLTIPGVAFDPGAQFRLAINTTSAAVDRLLTVGDETVALQLVAGPYLRVEGNGIGLTIAGQTLTGNFTFERLTAPNGTVVTTIGLSGITLSLGAGGNPIVSLTNGSGLFVVTGAGIAGRLGGTIAVTVPGGALSVSGSFTVEVNTTNADASASVVVNGVVQTLNIARGAKLRVVGTSVVLTIAGQTLRADVSFEQIAAAGPDLLTGTPDDIAAVRIGVANLSLSLGGGAVTVSNGSGALFLRSGGTQSTVAASLTATIGVSIPGVTVTGTLG